MNQEDEGSAPPFAFPCRSLTTFTMISPPPLPPLPLTTPHHIIFIEEREHIENELHRFSMS